MIEFIIENLLVGILGNIIIIELIISLIIVVNVIFL